jgi:HEPN domain-containing protein
LKYDPTRSTPAGYWRFAAQYFHAAQAVKAAHQQQLLFPLLQLYGQSIELALKAFLLERGSSLSDINNLRHDLSNILALARRRRLGTEVKLGQSDLALIQLLNENYSIHRFRYIVTGATQIPQPDFISPICERLVAGLEQYCTGQKMGALSWPRLVAS